MSSITERFLAGLADLAELAEVRAKTREQSERAKSQEDLGVEPVSTQGRKEKESRRVPTRVFANSPANPANSANSPALAYLDNASRGPCINCGQPVTRLGTTHGFRNGFGDLVHLHCPER